MKRSSKTQFETDFNFLKTAFQLWFLVWGNGMEREGGGIDRSHCIMWKCGHVPKITGGVKKVSSLFLDQPLFIQSRSAIEKFGDE